MCADPVTIAMAAFQVVKGVSEQNAAVERANAQNRMYLQNAANAKEAQLNDVRQLNKRQDQEAKAAAQKDMDLEIENAKKIATIETSAGEAGVAGLSVQRIMDDYDRQTAVAQGTVKRNFDMTADQLDSEREGTKYTFNNRVNSVSKGYAPSAMQAGLGIATSVGGTLYQDPDFKKGFNDGAKGMFGKLWA